MNLFLLSTRGTRDLYNQFYASVQFLIIMFSVSFSSFLLRCYCYCTSLLVRHCLSISINFTCFLLRIYFHSSTLYDLRLLSEIYVHSLRSTFTLWDLRLLIGVGMSNSFYIHDLGDLCSRVRSSGEILNPPISVQRLYCWLLVPTLFLCLFKALSHCFSRLYARSI